jgi:hypothetical protein
VLDPDVQGPVGKSVEQARIADDEIQDSALRSGGRTSRPLPADIIRL